MPHEKVTARLRAPKVLSGDDIASEGEVEVAVTGQQERHVGCDGHGGLDARSVAKGIHHEGLVGLKVLRVGHLEVGVLVYDELHSRRDKNGVAVAVVTMVGGAEHVLDGNTGCGGLDDGAGGAGCEVIEIGLDYHNAARCHNEPAGRWCSNAILILVLRVVAVDECVGTVAKGHGSEGDEVDVPRGFG